MSLEERLGTQWAVWVGGLALALGGIFLVRYSIEQGLVGPGVRVTLGALLAVALIAVGEWARRSERLAGISGLPKAHIPGILTAAGTTVAYADVYAAYALYGFLPPGAAFILLGLVALATLAAALLHGPALAGLGLVGAYVTPLLVASDKPDYWSLYVYLAVVTAAAFALARFRMWRWLAITAVAASALWTLPGLGIGSVEALGAHAFHVVAGFALAAILIVAGLWLGPDASARARSTASRRRRSAPICSRPPAWCWRAGTTRWRSPPSSCWSPRRSPSPGGQTRRRPRCRRRRCSPCWSSYAGRSTSTSSNWSHRPARWPGAVPEPERVASGWHLALGAAFAVLFGAAGYLAQGRAQQPIVAMLWSACAVSSPLAILAALYYRIASFEPSIPFAAAALLLSVLYALATERLDRRTPRPGLAAAAALFATGAVAALALALTMTLEKGWLTIALALMVPGIAWVADKRPLPALRVLAAAVGALVMARIAWEPRIVGDDVGTTPIFNWLLYGYGIPAAAFWSAAMLLRRRADDAPTRMIESGAILFTVLLAFLEIRHFINRRRRLQRLLQPGRACAAGLRRARHDDRARTAAPAHPQRGSRRRRAGRSRR